MVDRIAVCVNSSQESMVMTYEYTHAVLTREGHIGTLTLNRPEKLNAFTSAMSLDIIQAFKEVNEDRDIRVVVLTGAGRAFSAGADVAAWDAELQSGVVRTAADRWRLAEGTHALPQIIYGCRVPVIAKVRGASIGMGMDVALAADMRICSENAKFAMFYIKRGLIPDVAGAWLLPRLISPAKAAEIMYTGDFISGREAEQLGFVNRCVADDQLDAATDELAKKIGNGPPIATEMLKKALLDSGQLTMKQHLDQIAYFMSVINETEDLKEGMRSWVEKRDPVFQGR